MTLRGLRYLRDSRRPARFPNDEIEPSIAWSILERDIPTLLAAVLELLAEARTGPAAGRTG